MRLINIDPENWKAYAALAVAESQRGCVRDAVGCLARAYAYRATDGTAWGIEHEGTPVGVAMTRTAAPDFVLEELLIDADHQRSGHGRAAAMALLGAASRAGHPRAWVTIIAGNEASVALFSSLGFERSPAHDEFDGREQAWVLEFDESHSAW